MQPDFEGKYSMRLHQADPEQVILVLDVAKNMTALRLSRHEDPIRFPDTPHALLKNFKKKDEDVST